MCTYNGERFLAAQLASIAKQTRMPDELVVHDDKSSDHTVAILQEFAHSALFPVRIIENPRNLGYAANFEAAIRNCDADLIALADQDDVCPARISRHRSVPWPLSVMRTSVELPPSSNEKERAMQQQRRFNPTAPPLDQRLIEEAQRLRKEARGTHPGIERERRG